MIVDVPAVLVCDRSRTAHTYQPVFTAVAPLVAAIMGFVLTWTVLGFATVGPAFATPAADVWRATSAGQTSFWILVIGWQRKEIALALRRPAGRLYAAIVSVMLIPAPISWIRSFIGVPDRMFFSPPDFRALGPQLFSAYMVHVFSGALVALGLSSVVGAALEELRNGPLDVGSLIGIRRRLRRSLLLLGGMLVASVASSSRGQVAFEHAGALFPKEFVLEVALSSSVLLAIVYVPALASYHSAAERLLDEAFVAWDPTADDGQRREKASERLGIAKQDVVEDILTTLSPLASVIVSLAVGKLWG